MHTLRSVLGMLAMGALRMLAIVWRVVGNGCLQIGTVLCHLYDLVIFGPLWLEHMVTNRSTETAVAVADYGDDTTQSGGFSRE